ncbi:MAG: membrane-associated phospholipid phosphatase [Polyangiales bacterium]|jgi:membrane-associated phospholipid phosphatase
MKLKLFCLASLSCCAFPASAGAQAMPEVAHPPILWESAEVAERSMPWWPWIASAGLLGATLSLDLAVDTSTPRWRGVGPIDGAFGSWTASTIEGRRRAFIASDVILAAVFAMPVADAIFWPVPAGQSRSGTTYRLLAMDTLAFSFTTFVSIATKHITRRARPYAGPCMADSEHDATCGSSQENQSFASGHAAAAFTGASLVCTHQRLRGRTLRGHFACSSALAMASFVAALRVVAERHYVSDVVVGAAIGFVSGYLLPALFWRPRAPTPAAALGAAAW